MITREQAALTLKAVNPVVYEGDELTRQMAETILALYAKLDRAREGTKSAAVEAEEATRLLIFLAELLAPKLTEAEIYQLRRAKDFAECAAVTLKEIGE